MVRKTARCPSHPSPPAVTILNQTWYGYETYRQPGGRIMANGELSSPAPMVLHGRLCGRVSAAGILIGAPSSTEGAFFVLHLGSPILL